MDSFTTPKGNTSLRVRLSIDVKHALSFVNFLFFSGTIHDRLAVLLSTLPLAAR